MLTKKMLTPVDAFGNPRVSEFHHVTLKNADGTPVRARSNGRLKTWKRDASRWSLPVKHGMRDAFRIGTNPGEENPADWNPGDGR